MILTNKNNLPKRILDQISIPHQPKKDRISITDLIGCPRARTLLLERWEDVIWDYSDFLQTLLGISLHERQERIAENTEDIEAEVKFEDKFDNFVVVGKADNYTPSEETIRDTKVKAVGVLKYESFLKECEYQLNCYAYQRRIRGFPVSKLELDIYYRDWVKWQADKANLTRYAVMKKGRKTALKVFDNYIEADEWIRIQKINVNLFIEERKGNSEYPSLCLDHSISLPLWTLDEQGDFIQGQVELFNLDKMYCDDEYKWRNNLRCKEYCKARTVCELSPCCILRKEK